MAIIEKTGPWDAIFEAYSIHGHNFDKKPFYISAEEIKQATSHFKTTGEREVRILCKQDCREKRSQVFQESGLFLLPVKNGQFAIVKGEGFVDIPPIRTEPIPYESVLNFPLDTSIVGDSEMQHLDYAFAISMVRTFTNVQTLQLTIRGRKYTPSFNFKIGNHNIHVESVQTEVDAGYEGEKQVVLIEAKNSQTSNTIIRQLYYPYRQWQHHTKKEVITIFFERQGNTYCFWQFTFTDLLDYNSIKLVKSTKYITS